jgi:adenosylcobyric acid synthase
MTTQAIAVLGTGSDVGKSLIAAGLCRLLLRAGKHVAPFKAQNMSLNSFVTPDGGEIGRAQALQAKACGLLPHVDMNPILLKPESDRRSQVVVLGKVFAKLEASAYFDGRPQLWKTVQDSYARLAAQYDVLVIEGAGSAAEVNLRERDLVNWPVVRLADAQVLLVADIDRGGVFAQVIGTLDLLQPDERARVRGVVINKFRGDAALFDDGVRYLEARTGIPVLGVVPFLRDLVLDQEDSLGLRLDEQRRFMGEAINVAVILLPSMSNFTDFNLLQAEPDVVLRYVSGPGDLREADAVIVPGSKNTLDDLRYLRRKGFFEALTESVRSGAELIGICGGYQMLGEEIRDPRSVEAGGAEKGLGFLGVETELHVEKTVTQVQGRPLQAYFGPDVRISGYKIHMGVTTPRATAHPCFALIRPMDQESVPGVEPWRDGAVNDDGMVWGTYVHGVFDHPSYRRAWLNRIRTRKQLEVVPLSVSEVVTNRFEHEIDRWADHLSLHLSMDPLGLTIR